MKCLLCFENFYKNNNLKSYTIFLKYFGFCKFFQKNRQFSILARIIEFKSIKNPPNNGGF